MAPTELSQGFEGGGASSQAGMEDPSDSEVSDRPTACLDRYRSTGSSEATGPKETSPARSKVDTRLDSATMKELQGRVHSLGLPASAWVRSLILDALDQRRTEELDAAMGAALLVLEQRSQASADARHLAAQIRPLAININDLDARARHGQQVTLGADTGVLIELLRQVRELLGDRVAS